ncbi:MAG: DUF971 domain-containing protein [Deltaproteobacteria bacterium]|nr:DUF971 domain-containing protein [Deltaproteobacteria bacterium]
MVSSDIVNPKKITRENYSLKIEWADGHQSELTVSYLRRKCPCAQCKQLRGASHDGTIEIDEHLTEPIHFKSYQRVGHYALQFEFSDGHKDGIFSFDYLRKLCICDHCHPREGGDP